MTIHKIYKAQGVGGENVESVTIVFESEFPDMPTIDDATQAHEESAYRLAGILCNTLPGGTLDRLIVDLLSRKASSLTVPLFK